MKTYHKIFSVVFLIALLAFSVCNIVINREKVLEEISELESPKELSAVQVYNTNIDSVLTENLLFGYAWYEMYAKVHNFLGKNEENSFKYVKDKNQMLYPGNFWNILPNTSEEYAMRLVRLKEAAERSGANLVVLLYPNQYNEAWSDGYYGMPYSDYNYLTEELAAYLRYYNIDFIDFQDIYIKQGKTAEELFYKTDHHWRVELAFDAFVTLTQHLNDKYGENLDLFYTDKNNYTYETYENFFLGSQGRDAGVTYVGMDDFTCIVPKFETDYIYDCINSTDEYLQYEGDICDTLINQDILSFSGDYQRDLYGIYLNVVRYYDDITNLNNPEGLNVLFLRDSYASPLAVFFSAYCNKMELYWTLRNDAAEMEAAVESGKYDYIFFGLYPDNYSTGLELYIQEESKMEEIQ